MVWIRHGLPICTLIVIAWSSGASAQFREDDEVRRAYEMQQAWIKARTPVDIGPENLVASLFMNNLGTPTLRFKPQFARERLGSEEATEPPMRFPKLSIKHREFAVHPGYMSYYNPELQHIEDDIERKKGPRKARPEEEENPEVAEDPFDQKSEEEEDPWKTESDSLLKQILDDPFSNPIYYKKDSNDVIRTEMMEDERTKDLYFTIIVAGCSAAAAVAIVLAGVAYHRLQKNAKAAEDVDYPAYGVTGPGKETSPTSGGDRKLAQNAQMYHYQHQKQQMIAFDSHQNGGNRNRLLSDDDSDEGEEGDYTVYECPGLAPTGEMEVRNPMFSDDQTTPKASQK